MRTKRLLPLIVFVLTQVALYSQSSDSTNQEIKERLKKIEEELKTNPVLKKNYEDLTFYYSQIFKNIQDSQTLNHIKLSAYIDAYAAHYTDSKSTGEYQQFPTSAPISNTFGLNMAMFNVQYQNKNIHGVITCHAGDIAKSAWSEKYNFIQEANLGFRLAKKLWLEGGFFRTHLGFESIQPRENIGSTIAITTYYEPYYLSGAKLTYYFNEKFSAQVNAFNGFNTFVSINKKKAYGVSFVYQANSKLVFTLNSLLSDNTPDSVSISHKRLYNDFYMAYKSKRWNLGFETNFGIQENSILNDSFKTAYMFSMTAAAKYKMKEDRFSAYSRLEIFDDRNEILTGPVENQNHQLVGINAFGANLGVEYKPAPNAFLRLEGRYIHLWNNEKIFYYKNKFTNERMEYVASMGVWF